MYADEYGKILKRLSYDESRDILLRKLFGIDPFLIRNDVHLFRFLLHIHYDGPEIPEGLVRFVSKHLAEHKEFGKWDIELLTHDRAAFFRFLEENIHKNEAGNLPLEHSEIKVCLDNLVQDGLIHVPDGENKYRIPAVRDRKPEAQSLAKSIENLASDLPETHTGWLSFSKKWAIVVSSIYTEFHPETDKELFSTLHRTKKLVNLRFEQWLEKSYASFYNHPPSSPVMLHHVPRYLLQNVASGIKIALLVIDGLSLSQWKLVRSSLQQHTGLRYSIEEKALFAWIPTLTSVSRQALLSGKIPLLISRSLYGTQGEEKLWKNFWEDNNISPATVGYQKIQGDPHELNGVKELLQHPFQVAAIIVDKVDSIMHGQKQGSAMMHKEIRHWADSSFLASLLGILFRRYDEVFLTSDHGNDEAEGIGTFSQGSLIKEKGQRCRVYNDQQFLKEAHVAYPEAIPWPQIGLPENYYPLLAPYGGAFTAEDSIVVTHGGASMDEVIVPFIRFTGERS